MAAKKVAFTRLVVLASAAGAVRAKHGGSVKSPLSLQILNKSKYDSNKRSCTHVFYLPVDDFDSV